MKYDFNDYPILATHQDRRGVRRVVHPAGRRGPDMRCHWSNSEAASNSSQTSHQMTGQSSGNSSPVVVGGGDVNVTDGGAISAIAGVANSVINAALNQGQHVFDTVDQALQASQGASGQAAAAIQTLLSQQLASQTELAKNVQSGGATEQNKTILYALGIGAAVLGLVLWRRK